MLVGKKYRQRSPEHNQKISDNKKRWWAEKTNAERLAITTAARAVANGD